MYVAWACLDLGSAHVRGDELDLAEPYLLRAHALADSLGNPFLLGETERTLAQVAAERGDRDAARTLLDRAIQRGRSVGASTLLRQALVDKAEYLQRQGDLEGADSLLAEAIGIVESVRGRQAGENLRLGFLTDKKSIYVARVAVLYELGATGGAATAKHVEAFHVAERARARSLLDVVSGTQADPGDFVDPPLRDRELQTVLSQAVSAEAWEASRVDSLEALHASTVQEYRLCLDEIATRSPAYAALAGQRPVLGLDEIRSRVLAADQVLFEYLVGEHETYLFLVDRERLRLVRIPAGADSLAAQVAALRGALTPAGAVEGPLGGTESAQETADGATGAAQGAVSQGATSNVLSPLQQLFAVLVRPVAEDIGDGSRLLIVPDGPLFHLPFAALHDGERFLIERHAVAYAPSASVLDPELRKGKRRGENVVLAVGNPATYRSTELLASLRDAERWRFGALPYAEEEVVRIAAYFRRASTFTGSAATEEAVKSAIGRARYVHFATHGLLDEEEPMWSGLVLAQDDDPAEDGLLQAHEILKLDLAADLVALSACNTGLGRLAGGEGVIGLTRAFLYAGARAVLVSLWEVADRSTMDLMSSFYAARLDRGLLPDVALQQAQVAALAAGGTVREWAPFLLTGNPATATRSAHAARLLFLLGVLILVALVVLRWGFGKRPRMRAAAGGA